MLSYRVILDVPTELALYLARLLRERRREIGTPRGTRALSCWRQAVFALAWFRDRPDVARLGKGFGISQATAYRYLAEVIDLLAARAPSLRQALEKAKEQGLAYLIPDGKIVASDRCTEKSTSRKGKQIDRWYSGKAHGFGGNIQALFAPSGVPLWVSDVLPGGAHDITAAREHVLPGLRSYLKDLPVLADSEGAGIGVHVPVKRPPGSRELDLNTRTRNMLLASLRCRSLTRTRSRLVQDQVRHQNRVEKILEDALLKISVVISDLFGASGRRFLDALVAGERSPAALAALGDRRLRATRQQLASALTGRFREVHAFEIATHLRLIDTINDEIARLDARIEQQLTSIPGVAPACGSCGLIGGGHSPGCASDGTPVLGLPERLDEITGVGVCNAQVLIAELGAGYYSSGNPQRQTRSRIRELERLNPGMKVTLTPIEPATAAA